MEIEDQGRFLDGHLLYIVFPFSVIILNYSIQQIWNFIDDKTIHPLMLYIEISLKSVGVGLHFALLKDN